MEVEIADVMLNYSSPEKRMEITVKTAAGESIVFPSAQFETQPKVVDGVTKQVLYAYARIECDLPTPHIYTFFIETESDDFTRQCLEVTQL